MYSKLKENLYQCNSCDKVLKTENGMEAHIKKNHIAPQAKALMAKELEDIRITSKSIHEVIERTTALWLENGIKVSFRDYPHNFVNNVSNTHNAPSGYEQNWGGQSHLPKGYPGWSGSWAGTVEVIDKQRWPDIRSFSDLISSWRSDLPSISWIKTGSGGGVEDFHFSGMLFLYDFPTMHEQFKAEGKEFKVLEDEYNRAVKDYTRQYKTEREYYVQTSELMEELSELQDALHGVSSMLSKANKQVIEHLHGDFSASYSKDVPKPNSMLIDDEVAFEALQVRNIPTSPPPNLGACHTYIKTLADRLGRYIKDNPEIMI